MGKMILASSNKHKMEEIKKILDKFDINLQSMAEAGLEGFEIVEDGETFEENSMKKAVTILDELGIDTIADDSGLMVDKLDGRPGVYSARYSGENANADTNNEKLLMELDGVPLEERTAKFVCVISIAFKNGEKICVRGECPGKIGFEKKGENGFGYDPLFIVDGYDKTFAEISGAEKNKISHRAKALEKLEEIFQDIAAR
ncbi:MAG: XTP/dITP diphosphatase [Firmicutes bacterium]|jgi:XTP/dITP diphosphohydrolase|nr:XTP/dITP diphosphatase [Bacillota bacterium]